MIKTKNILAMVMTVSLFIWCLWPERAVQAEASGATDQVKAVLEKAMEIQTRADLQGDANRKERGKLVRQLIGDNFLAGDMARESLKGQWEKLSQGQRSEFQDLFSKLFQDSYTRMVLNFLQRETVEYRGESKQGNATRVSTVIMRANEHIPVDYDVVQKGGRWLIGDVTIDGVSIVDNYRSTFSRVIQKGSVDALLKNMRVQVEATHGDI